MAKSIITRDPDPVTVLYELLFPNGKRYFGMTVRTAKTRFWWGHVNSAKYGSKLAVHCAIRKYGSETVKVFTRVIGRLSYIKLLEISAIVAYQTMDRRYGYNRSPGGDLSPMLNSDVVDRMAEALTGRKLSPEHRANIGKGRLGFKHTQEAKDKIGTGNKGNKKSPESLARGVATRRANGNYVVSEEQVAKIIKTRSWYRHSQETKDKIGAGGKGKHAGENRKRDEHGRFCSVQLSSLDSEIS